MPTLRDRARHTDDTDTVRVIQTRVVHAFGSEPWTPAADPLTVMLRSGAEAHRDMVWPRRTLDYLGIKPWNPVSHVRVTCLSGPVPAYTKYDFPWPLDVPRTEYVYSGDFQPFEMFGFPEVYAAGLGGMCDLTDPLIPGLPDGSARFHSRKALETILQQVPERISIANFLWELKNGLRSLLPRITHWLNAVGSGWLWYNFAALPLVRDIKAMLTLVKDVRNRLAYLRKVNGQTVTVNYHGRSQGEVPNGIEKFTTALSHAEGYNPSDTFLSDALAFPLWDDIQFRLHARVNYDLDLKGADVFLDAMCAALGLNNLSQIVWHAIPFSFVVDWFVNCSDWLEQNVDTDQPFDGEIRILGSDHSIVRRTMWEHCALTDNRGGYEVFARTLVRAYHRRAGIFMGLIDTEGLTGLQLSLALALVSQGLGSRPHQRLRRVRRRPGP